MTAQAGKRRHVNVETTLHDLVEMYKGDRPSKADLEAARLLGVQPNTPMAEVRRVLCAPDRTILYLAEVSYRGDYIHLEMDMKP